MKTYEEMLKPEFIDKILAHTSKNKKPERLIEHSQKTLEYSKKICEQLGLTNVFKKIILQILPKEFLPVFIEIIESIIYCHDFGKINPVFQKDKMRNDLSIKDIELTSNHSFYGKILFDALFLNYFYDKIKSIRCTNKDINSAFYLFFLLSQPIDRHHSSLKDIDFLAEKMNSDEATKEELKHLNQVANQIVKGWGGLDITYLASCYEFKHDYKSKLDRFSPEQKEAIFYLYKLIYSLLITSDYYATMDYMQGIKYFDHIKFITPDLKNSVMEEFYREKTINNKKYNYNSKLLNEKVCKLLLKKDINKIGKLNDLRTRILLEADETLKKTIKDNPDKRVFYLKVPTGGGKTNISLKLILALLDKKDIKKVFYVFPFINIIEQNYAVIKETLSLNNEISPVYSTSSWNFESESKDEQLRYVLDNEFLNFPFVVMSNVNFFNAFIKAGKASNYRLLNLANSIVVLDEIQSLNDKDWTVFQDFITFGSKYLNIHFIIMSATLPSLDNIWLGLHEEQKIEFFEKSTNLIENPDIYFNHPKFNSRVKFEYLEEVLDLSQVLALLKEEVNKSNPNKILTVLNTIEDSRDLYKEVNTKDFINNGYSIYLLNSTILPHRRKEIISEINKKESKVILISTQSVEAGVDIDCNFGIRDFAVFDSIEQIAGRINRNFKKKSARLIIVNLKEDNTRKAQYVYKGTHRWNSIKEYYASSEEIKKFLSFRDFNCFYGKVIDFIKLRNKDKIRENPLDDIVKTGIRELNFSELNKMNVIGQKSISFFTNVEIPLNDYFSESEKTFLNKVGVQTTNKVSGQEVWIMYKDFNKKFNKGVIGAKIDTKLWSSILSKFVFSVQDYGDQLRKELNLSEKENIIFLKEGYSIKEGINPKTLAHHPEWIDSSEKFFV